MSFNFIILDNLCETNNGLCDNITSCTLDGNGNALCGPCPDGYNGTGVTGCTGMYLSSFPQSTLIPM